MTIVGLQYFGLCLDYDLLNWKTWWILDNRKVSPIICYLRHNLPTKGYKIHLSCRKNTLQQYFAKTRDYNQFVKPISKSNFQCQSFTNTVIQHQNNVQA